MPEDYVLEQVLALSEKIVEKIVPVLDLCWLLGYKLLFFPILYKEIVVGARVYFNFN